MALEIAYTSSHGVESKQAYHRIYKIIYNVRKTTSATAYAEVYYNDMARRQGFDPIDTVEFDFVMDVSKLAPEPVTQAYNSLKTKSIVTDNRGKTKSLDYSKAKDV
tara:strand:+ start:1398 stop:1715 length:318 start_codon:yes stop_codon:yes gene_type:complete